jgi:ribonuclease HII
MSMRLESTVFGYSFRRKRFRTFRLGLGLHTLSAALYSSCCSFVFTAVSESGWLPRSQVIEDLVISFRFEEEAASLGAQRIAGIDEAGRGPLAGPVVAAAVIMRASDLIPEVNDSKLLTAAVREKLFAQIREKAVAVGVGIVSSEVIDEINIYQATRLAMRNAVMEIAPLPDYLLIDGPISLELDMPQRPIVKGDRQSFSVAAAAIIAKVTRDRIMLELHEQYPQYGFDRHKGYGTKTHKDAIAKHGPSPIHRMCFRGVKEPEFPLFDV